MNKIFVVGVGADGQSSLTLQAMKIIDGAELLVGTERLLAMFPASRAQRLRARSGLNEVIGQIDALSEGRKVVVLASGDPGFFGIAGLLVSRFGKERVEIVPNVSCVQLAFARIKESWEDATFVSVHGRPLAGLGETVRESSKVAILTDPVNSPAVVARFLLASGVQGYRAYLCENLGGPDERVCEMELEQLAGAEASPLSLLVLVRDGGQKPQVATEGGLEGEDRCDRRGWLLGIPDDEFEQLRPQHGLITKMEIRVVSLAKLCLRETSVVWDIGSGCGSVAIEAAMIARLGKVYAIERNTGSVELIRRNLEKFRTGNVVLVHGTAPAALETLPAPDAVFVGGSGGQLCEILDVVDRRLAAGGGVVANAATLETAAEAMVALRARGFSSEITLMQVCRSKELAGLTRFEALNPVFIVSGRRGANSSRVS